MKLKLDSKNEIKILHVSEKISVQEIPILKVGLIKLFDTEIAPILLELQLAAPPEASVANELTALKALAKGKEVLFAVAGNVPGVCDAPTLEEGLKLLEVSPDSMLLAMETRLKNRQKTLQEKKTALEAQLNQMSKDGGDVKTILGESSRLRKAIRLLEFAVGTYARERGADPDLQLNDKNLELDGILKAGLGKLKLVGS